MFGRCPVHLQNVLCTLNLHPVSRSDTVFNVIFNLRSIFRSNLHPASRFFDWNFTLTVKTPGKYLNLFRFTDEGTDDATFFPASATNCWQVFARGKASYSKYKRMRGVRPWQTSVMKLLGENSERFKKVNYFTENLDHRCFQVP